MAAEVAAVAAAAAAAIAAAPSKQRQVCCKGKLCRHAKSLQGSVMWCDAVQRRLVAWQWAQHPGDAAHLRSLALLTLWPNRSTVRAMNESSMELGPKVRAGCINLLRRGWLGQEPEQQRPRVCLHPAASLHAAQRQRSGIMDARMAVVGSRVGSAGADIYLQTV